MFPQSVLCSIQNPSTKTKTEIIISACVPRMPFVSGRLPTLHFLFHLIISLLIKCVFYYFIVFPISHLQHSITKQADLPGLPWRITCCASTLEIVRSFPVENSSCITRASYPQSRNEFPCKKIASLALTCKSHTWQMEGMEAPTSHPQGRRLG